MDEEMEAVRESVSSLTAARFEILEPKPDFFAHAQRAKWFIHCPYRDELEKTLHVEALWEDEADEIWIESASLGDSTRWIEAKYGEEGCIEAQEIDFTNFDSETRRKLGNQFPLVERRLVGYERTLSKISAKRGVELRMRYDGSKGVVFFYVDAVLDAKGLDLGSKIEKIRINIEALKETLREIDKFEKRWTRVVG